MNEMNLAEFPDEEIILPEEMNTSQFESTDQSPIEFSNLKYFEVKSQQNQFNNTTAVLDMLILYDEDARANENNDPNDPNPSIEYKLVYFITFNKFNINWVLFSLGSETIFNT